MSLLKYKSLPADPGRGSPIHQWGAINAWRLGDHWTVEVDVPLSDLESVDAEAIDRGRLASVKAHRLSDGSLPPIELAVWPDGSSWIVDGNHRLVDARQARLPSIRTIFTWVAPKTKNPPRRPRSRVSPRSLDLNRNGFPWPVRTECFHATSATKEILKTGFLTREQGAPEALGGRWKRSVSLTLSLPRAVSIALGLETLILGASKRMSCVELLERLVREVPGGIPDGLVSGYDLQDVVFAAQKAGVKDPAEGLFPVFERLDQGWDVVAFLEHGEIPVGAEQIGHRSWLVPPGLSAGFEYVTDFRKAFFETYRSVLHWASNAKEAFNPHFTGTDMAALAKKDPAAVGVISSRCMIPRVCTDARGAVRLGYATHDEMKARPEVVNMLQSAEISCQAALEGGSEYDVERGRTPLGLHRWHDPKIGGYAIDDSGERTKRNTMLFHEREEELIVYATDRIVVDEVALVSALREDLGLGDRITFPWFDDKGVDVRVVRRP